MSQPPADPNLSDPTTPGAANVGSPLVSAMVPPPPPPLYPPAPLAAANPVDAAAMPRSVKAARVIFFIGAGLTILMLIGAIMMKSSAAQLGYIVGSTLPGYLALVVGIGLGFKKRVWWVLALVVSVLWILGGLGNLGRGDVRGLIQMVLPSVAMVLLLQPAARAYYAKKAKA